jgi:hypothetical protein
MRFFAFLAALVIFIIAALLGFFTNEGDFGLRALIGLVSVGLACLTLAFTPAPPQH